MPQAAAAAVAVIVSVGKYVAGSFAAVSAGTATAAQIATVVGSQIALSVGAQLLLAPKVGGYGGSPSEWRADPDAGLPFVLGEFGIAGNIVYREAYGPDNRFQSLVSVYTANGPVHEWGAFTADDIGLTFGANDAAVTGPDLWQGNVYRQLRDGTASDTALSSPAGLEGGASLPGWGAAYRLPGLASSMITLRGDNKNKRFPTGEPSPFQRLKAPKYSYDPRLDSTYPGGDGPHRRDNKASWSYSDDPYILGLNFELGYWTGNGFGLGKLIGGSGKTFENIDVASYVEGANIAQANGWRVGGMFRSTDNKHEVHRAILQAGGGIYANPNGKTGCVCRGAVRASLLNVTYADIAGDIELSADIPFTDKINSVIPRAPLPAFKYEMDALAEVVVPDFVSADGGLRQRRVDFPMVPGNVQAAQLAAYAIVNSRERVSGRVPMQPWMRELRPGDCFTFQTPGLNLDGVKVMVLDREWNPDSQIITITFQSETDSKHAFALGLDPDPPEPSGLTVPDTFEVPAPDGTQWAATGGVIGTPGGVTQPGIDLVGGNEPNMVTGVWIEYRRGTSSDWATWFKGEAGEADYSIAGLVAGATDYYVSIRYANQLGVWNDDADRLILGPLTVGDLVSSDAIGPSQAIADARDRIAAVKETLAEAIDAANEALGGVEGLTQEEAVEQGYEILRQSGVQNLIIMSGDEAGEILWRQREEETDLSFAPHDGWNGMYAEREAAEAGETIVLYLADKDGSLLTIPWSPKGRGQVAVHTALEGLAVDPVVRVLAFDADGAPLDPVELDEDLNEDGSRYGGLIEPLGHADGPVLPAQTRRIGLEVEVAASGAGLFGIELSRPLIGMATPTQQDVEPWQPSSREAVRRLTEQKFADAERTRSQIQAEFIGREAQTSAGIAIEASADAAIVAASASAASADAQADAMAALIATDTLVSEVTTLSFATADAQADASDALIASGDNATAITNLSLDLADTTTTANSALSASGDNATAITNLSLDLGDAEATLAVLASAYLDESGDPRALFAVELDVNGNVAGLFGYASGTSTGWVFLGDTFEIRTASGTVAPFSVIGDTVKMLNVEVDTMAADSIETGWFKTNVITDSSFEEVLVEGSTGGLAISGSGQTLVYTTWDKRFADTTLEVSYMAHLRVATNDNTATVRLFISELDLDGNPFGGAASRTIGEFRVTNGTTIPVSGRFFITGLPKRHSRWALRSTLVTTSPAGEATVLTRSIQLREHLTEIPA